MTLSQLFARRKKTLFPKSKMVKREKENSAPRSNWEAFVHCDVLTVMCYLPFFLLLCYPLGFGVCRYIYLVLLHFCQTHHWTFRLFQFIWCQSFPISCFLVSHFFLLLFHTKIYVQFYMYQTRIDWLLIETTMAESERIASFIYVFSFISYLFFSSSSFFFLLSRRVQDTTADIRF